MTTPDSTPTEREADPPCVAAGHHGPYYDDGRCRGCGAQIRQRPEPTEREAGDVGEVAAVLAAHQFIQRGRIYDTCSCRWYGSSHTAHLADALAPLIAERERAAWLSGFRAHRDGDLKCPHNYTKGDHHWESGDCLADAVKSTTELPGSEDVVQS